MKCNYTHNYQPITVIHNHYHYYVSDRFMNHRPYDNMYDSFISFEYEPITGDLHITIPTIDKQSHIFEYDRFTID